MRCAPRWSPGAKRCRRRSRPMAVTVNVILPGRIHTERVDEMDAFAAKQQNTSIAEVARVSQAAIPMGRYGTVGEFAAVAAFLASDLASYVTGSLLRVDGGSIRSLS